MVRAAPDFAAAVGAAAGVAAVAAGVPVLAGVGVVDFAAVEEPVASATVAGVFSFLPQPTARSAAERARGRSRIFMAQITLGAGLRHAKFFAAQKTLIVLRGTRKTPDYGLKCQLVRQLCCAFGASV